MLLVAMLLLAAALGAIGAGAESMQPSALRIAVTAVLAALSLLFWPGAAHAHMHVAKHTALRVLGWSLAVALLAAVTLRVAGQATQTWPKILGACALLWLMLVVAHALAAALEWRLRSQGVERQGVDSHAAREDAGRSVAVAMLLLGALPLWLGPLAELASPRHEWAIDAAIAASPLTHLAVASGNDLLRNQWLYQHANLAALQFSYPALAMLAWCYALAGLALALALLAWSWLRRGLRQAGTPPTPFDIERAT